MKKRNTFIAMAILLAVLILGIGYAAVSNVTLNINGEANVKANADFTVVFDQEHTVVKSTTDTIAWTTTDMKPVVAGAYTDDLNATMTVYLDKDHRTASATYKIDNKSEELGSTLTAAVTPVDGEYADYFEITKEFTDKDSAPFAEGTSVLAAKDSAFVKVTVTLKKLPVEDIAGKTFKVQITADPKDSDAKN